MERKSEREGGGGGGRREREGPGERSRLNATPLY